ncbi:MULTISPECIES: type VII secretion system-associated protein [Streptomyces]|uniref:type VII secretion system-associated protein n=1 Tax=Streptomyces TaxID=1883 RepID=UPI0022B2DA54|nr:type VII secretion system-associated protein [Streptomyces sp. ActVer]MCZ4515942.1 type VII secretion system-associated protein [Streptomyces sp. ActVer]WSS90532.1 type VII secretion system-associated protein [Streptomyces phaeochromogenes]WSW11727.1 type VII secretion system-associated protein [Streptomyces phaeochromogenes]WTA01330.1 type VII secretion system-associated protein [Streptomyces phaeochromogenes]
MAGEKADVKHFDLKQMENFRDNEVQPVYTAAKKHREEGDGSTIRPLGHLVDGHTTPDNLDQDKQLLRIGKMVTEPLVSGPKLIEGVRTAAEAIDKLLGDQMDLFKELKEALSDTIEEANKTKNKNLDAIDAQTLLQTFEEVDTLTAGSTEEED